MPLQDQVVIVRVAFVAAARFLGGQFVVASIIETDPLPEKEGKVTCAEAAAV